MNPIEATAAHRSAPSSSALTDVDPHTGALLSVAQLQQALRQLRSAATPVSPAVTPAVTPARRGVTAVDRPAVIPRFGPLFPVHALSPGIRGLGVVVRSAHSGAGSSTVALAVADAAAAAGQPVQLVGLACPTESGLVAVTETELGVDGTGRWLRGARGAVTVDRLLDEDDGRERWPPTSRTEDPAQVTVVDVGQLTGPFCSLTVLVCRVSVPALRAAERAFTLLGGTTVLLAAVGPKRWPGAVTATAGPQVHRLREQGRLVSVPVDHRLEVSGLTATPLPKAITAAGRQLLSLALTHSGPGATS